MFHRAKKPNPGGVIAEHCCLLFRMTTVQEPSKAWIYCGIPFRPVKGTYSYFRYDTLPPVNTDAFAHLGTLADVQANAEQLDDTLRSPTACYVRVNEDSRIFYRDQQDCVLWRFRPDIGVYVTDGDEDIKNQGDGGDVLCGYTVVASSIAEFFARCAMENGIWFKSAYLDHPDAYASSNSFFASSPLKDAAGLWAALKSKFTTAEATYMLPYYTSYVCSSEPAPRHIAAAAASVPTTASDSVVTSGSVSADELKISFASLL